MTRIATFNVLHGVDVARGGRIDLDAAAAVVDALDVDVVGLQEVDRSLPRSGEVDQVARLCATLGDGWQGVFAPALLGDPDEGWTVPSDHDPGGPAYGVGIITRLRLTDPARLRLPGGGAGHRVDAEKAGWDREPRTALRARVEVPEGAAAGAPSTLQVTTTHLSYLPWRGLAQLRSAARWAGAGAGPAVLAGDLNLPAGVVRSVLPGWRHARGRPTYPAQEPRVQVDQILARGCRPARVRVAPTTSSDHLPLVADLRYA